MSVGFRAVQWNRDKIRYDAILIAGVIVAALGAGVAIFGASPAASADGVDRAADRGRARRRCRGACRELT